MTDLATIERFDHRFTWTADEVALVGRRGGAVWETLGQMVRRWAIG